ncbi:MAG: cytochrome c-type biogenesis protein CcmH [Acidimicrobiales bacterium]
MSAIAGGRPRRSRRFPLWIALGVVLVGAMVIGSGVLNTVPPTPAQRAVAIETEIKCPQCEDLSAADSSAQTAVFVRRTVRRLIARGRSDRQIRAYLVSRYGQSIVLVPPASGWSLLVWVIPLGGGAVAIALLTTVLVRKRRSVFADPAETDRAEAKDKSTAGPARLGARRRFLEQSLADAFAEHRAGDLSDEDYRALRRRDSARLAALDARMDEMADAVPVPSDGVGDAATGPTAIPTASTVSPSIPRPRRTGRQRFLLSGAVAAFAAALILVVALFATNRLPGETSSGNVTVGKQARAQRTLAQAATLENEGHAGEAVRLYQRVLRQYPKNEVAMAQLGWLEYRTGVAGKSVALIADGTAKLDQAVHLNPGDYAARLYLGTVLLDHGNDPAAAVTQYRAFLAARPPVALVDQAAPEVRRAYVLARVPVPPEVRAG